MNESFYQYGTPLQINASINLRNILDVAEKEQIISLETTLRLYWKVSNSNTVTAENK